MQNKKGVPQACGVRRQSWNQKVSGRKAAVYRRLLGTCRACTI